MGVRFIFLISRGTYHRGRQLWWNLGAFSEISFSVLESPNARGSRLNRLLCTTHRQKLLRLFCVGLFSSVFTVSNYWKLPSSNHKSVGLSSFTARTILYYNGARKGTRLRRGRGGAALCMYIHEFVGLGLGVRADSRLSKGRGGRNREDP